MSPSTDLYGDNDGTHFELGLEGKKVVVEQDEDEEKFLDDK